MQIHYRFNVVN